MKIAVTVAATCFASSAGWAQIAPAGKPTDVNIYPTLAAPGGLYDLNVASAQNGPPGTIAVTSASPPHDYSFQDVLANTHGYVSAGVSSGNGHSFDGGVSIPLVPGRAELELGASTGQLPTFRIADARGGKAPSVTYDSYNVGLALHPADNVEAYIGVSSVRLHSSGLGGFGSPGITVFPNP